MIEKDCSSLYIYIRFKRKILDLKIVSNFDTEEI